MANKEWTVMVYMAADNSHNEDLLGDLTTDAASDLYEMMSVGSNEYLDIVVQIDWKAPKIPERRHILADSANQLQYAPGIVDMGVPAELEDFVGWAQEKFSAKYYLLILWGHSYRYAFGYDGDDALNFQQLSEVFGKYRVDILGFDSCGMSAIESAYQLRKHVPFMLASEIGEPLQGWPYERILRALTPGITPEAVGRAIVEEFIASYPDKTVALTMLDLRRAPELLVPMRELGRSLAMAVGSGNIQREKILDLFRKARVPTGEPMVDLRELCENLTGHDVDDTVRYAADAMRTLLAEGNGFVVVNGRRGAEAEGLCGVGAYAPHVGRSQDAWLQTYDLLDLSGDTCWPQVVRFLASADSQR